MSNLAIAPIYGASIYGLPLEAFNYASLEVECESQMEAIAENPYVDFVTNENRRLVYAVEISVRGRMGSGNTSTTLYAATEDFITLTGNTPSQTLILGQLLRNFAISRDIPLSGSGANMQTTAITLKLDNSDFINGSYPYDTYASGYIFEGQEIEIKVGESTNGIADYDSFYLVGRYVVRNKPTIDQDEVTIEATDKMYLLDAPAQPEVYSGVGGLEGNSEVANKRKPWLLGLKHGVAPAPIMPVDLVYQVSFRSVQSILQVYDTGAPLEFDADYGTFADLLGATLSGGYYATCNAQGIFRLGWLPSGPVTCDVEGDNVGGYIETRSEIIKRIVEVITELEASDISDHAFEVAAALRPAVIGYHISHENEKTVSQCVSDLLPGAFMFLGFSREGLLEIGIIEPPGIVAVARFDNTATLKIDVDQLPEQFSPPSPHQRVTYSHNDTVLDTVAGVDRERVASLQAPYKVVSTSDFEAVEILADNPLAKELEIVLGYYDEADDANAEAKRRHNLFSVERVAFSSEIFHYAFVLDLMDTVHITKDTPARFGLGEGKMMRVLAVTDTASDEGDKAAIRTLT